MTAGDVAPDELVVPSGQLRLHVVIVNFFTAGLVAPLVASLPGWTIPVVVDNSADPTEAAALKELDGAEIIIADENLGFAAGVNRGTSSVESSWVLLLNPDARISEDALGRLWEQAKAAQFDVSSPVIVDPVDDTIWYAGGRFDRLMVTPTHEGFNEPVSARLGSGDPRPAEFVSGCIMLLSPLAVRELLPLREDLFMYWEDVDLCLRAHERGLRCGVIPAAMAEHPKGRDQSLDYHYYRMRNRLVVARTTPSLGLFRAMVSTPLVLARELREIRRSTIDRKGKVAAACRGVADGLRQGRRGKRRT
jgi:N-acetylglucosaminyl-diphospho-decaprenol L-rhamnosyltransferase